MEDAERIILQHLKQVGCDFEVESIKDFDAEMTLEAVVRCLRVIISDFSAPETMPHNMVAKYNIGIKLSDAIKALGFKGDLGYQSFLYSNDIELRRIFSFLIDKTPKEDKSSPVQPASGPAISRAAGAALKTHLERPWLPRFIRKDLRKFKFSPVSLSSSVPVDDLLAIRDSDSFIASVLNANALLKAGVGLGRDEGIRLIDSRREQPIQDESEIIVGRDKPEDNAQREESSKAEDDARRVEIEELLSRNAQLGADMDLVDQELEGLIAEGQKVECRLQEAEEELKAEQSSGKIRVKANELIVENGPERALKICNEYLEQLKERSLKLGSDWEEHRQPLTDDIRELRLANSMKFNKHSNKRERINRLNAERQRLIQDYALKKELAKQLQTECDSLKDGGSATLRSSYLSRIREIVSSVSRQCEEIDKILIDNRQKQREMNVLSDRLERSFAAAELFFAKQSVKSEDAKRMHRSVGEIHKDCTAIFEAVEGNGSTQREIRDLVERIEKERESKVEENLQRITADYNQMKMENDAIETELTKKGFEIDV